MNEDFDDLVITQAVKNSGNLEVAFKTYKLWQDILNRLVTLFFEELRIKLLATLPKVGGEWTVELSKPANMRTAMNIYLSNSKWQNIVFGIGDYDGDRVHFFIRSEEENRKELYEYIKSKINGEVVPNMWYHKANIPYNTWDLTIEGLMEVYHIRQLSDDCTSRLNELAVTINDYLNR
jgi:hypothetical protein